MKKILFLLLLVLGNLLFSEYIKEGTYNSIKVMTDITVL